MTTLERAIDATRQIRDALASQIVVAREERVFIRQMDVDGLQRRAAQRSIFNQQIATLQQALTTDLAQVRQDLGLDAVTLDELKERAPVLGRTLSSLLAEVRAAAAALSELDHLNRLLGRRALSYVRAHLAVICPKPSAYDRRGGTASDARASTVVRVL